MVKFKISRKRKSQLVVSRQAVTNQCCRLVVIFCGFNSLLIGHETINIPEIFSGAHSFTGNTVIKFFYFALNAVLLFVQTQPRYIFLKTEKILLVNTLGYWYILNFKSATFKLLAMGNLNSKVAYFALNTVLLFHGHNIYTCIAFH